MARNGAEGRVIVRGKRYRVTWRSSGELHGFHVYTMAGRYVHDQTISAAAIELFRADMVVVFGSRSALDLTEYEGMLARIAEQAAKLPPGVP